MDFTQTLCEMLGIPKSSLLGLEILIMVPWGILGEGKLRKQLRVVQAEGISEWDHRGETAPSLGEVSACGTRGQYCGQNWGRTADQELAAPCGVVVSLGSSRGS